jgi:PEP-CTERM motif
MRKMLVAWGVVCILLLGVQSSRAGTILVGQCVEGATCWTSSTPTPWSDSLTLTQLEELGLGASVPLVAAQTSEYIIRLGVTTMVFDTTSGMVTETLPEFSGGYHLDPCNFCEIDTVGFFSIPSNSLSAPCAATTPEPASLLLLGSAVVMIAAFRRRLASWWL